MKPRLLVLLALALASCADDPDLSAPATVEELRRVVLDTDTPVCTLDLSALSVDLDAPEWASLTDVSDGDVEGEALRAFFRRAALRRHALSPKAMGDYEVIGEGMEPTTLGGHVVRVRAYTDARDALGELEADSPDHNAAFCVVNDLGASVLVPARAAALDEMGNPPAEWDPDIYPLLDALIPEHAAVPGLEAFSRRVLAHLAEPESLPRDALAELALLRSGGTAVVPTDPTDTGRFEANRDLEVDAALKRIAATDYATVAEELAARTRLEQSLRGVFRRLDHFGGESLDWFDAIATADGANTARLKDLLETREWFRDDRDGEGAASDAWLIAQHADHDPDFQRAVLPRMEAALGQPGVSARNYAYLHDRVAGKDGRPQRYGTQGRCTDGEWNPDELEDPDRVDAWRAEVGLDPLADYKARFRGICP